MKYLVPALCLGLMIGIGSASAQYAQTPAPSSAPAPSKSAAPAKKERSQKSIECSKKADEKGLHGKDRQKFRSKCKKGEA